MQAIEGIPMTDPFADRIVGGISQAAALYYRLVLVVGPSGAGKTPALRAVRDRTGAPLTNVGLELSRQMLNLTARQRTLRLPRLLQEIVEHGADPRVAVLLDNTEILFCADLEQDPLRLLQGLSRNRTVVAAWNGAITAGRLRYATPDHAEHRHYPVRDFLAVNLEADR